MDNRKSYHSKNTRTQSKIYDYNRVVKDLNGLSVELFLDKNSLMAGPEAPIFSFS